MAIRRRMPPADRLGEASIMFSAFDELEPAAQDQGLSIAKSKRSLKQAIESLLEGQASEDT